MRTIIRKTGYMLICCGMFALFFAGSWTDIFRSVPEEAEQAYESGDYEQALELYQESQTRQPDSDTLAYNLGNTLYELGRFQEAANQYARILEKDRPGLGPRAVYNMGNTLYRMGSESQNQEMLQKSLEAFKHSILMNPSDKDSKYNYELVKKLIREQQQQQQQNQDKKDQDQNQKENKDQQQQQKQQQDQDQQQQQQQEQDRKEQQDRKQQQQQPQPGEQQEQKQEQQQAPRPAEMSKEEAERILNALMQMEKEMQRREKEKQKAAAGTSGPDW